MGENDAVVIGKKVRNSQSPRYNNRKVIRNGDFFYFTLPPKYVNL